MFMDLVHSFTRVLPLTTPIGVSAGAIAGICVVSVAGAAAVLAAALLLMHRSRASRKGREGSSYGCMKGPSMFISNPTAETGTRLPRDVLQHMPGLAAGVRSSCAFPNSFIILIFTIP